ncbi:MAG: glycosyltransferase family 39 protein [Phycisphaerales bacterium]|nr:glycosyltransferase family 39 protein [Phycisphaerales bacterium]
MLSALSPSPRRRLTLLTYAVPLVLALAFYFPGILFRAWLYDAGLYAAVSLRMARTGEWWTPMQANATYFNKPPLAFWTHALFVKCIGEADWVLRLPNLLAALACVVLTTSIARRLHGPRVGLLAGILLALTAEYIWRISRFRLDFMHTALMLAGIRMIVQGVGSGARTRGASARGDGVPRAARAWIILSGLPIGLALLVKPMFGLIALVLAGIWLYFIARHLVKWIPAAAALAIAIAAPWHVSMYAIHGRPFIDRYFLHESLDRATGAQFAAEPWWWYFRHILNTGDAAGVQWFDTYALWYWPILACVLLALVWWLRGRRLGRRTAIRGGLLAQIYTGGLLLALCAFGDKKPWYLIPVYPGLAWIAALWLSTVLPRAAQRWAVRLGLPVAALGLALVLVTGTRFELGNARAADTRPLQRFIRNHPEGEFWNASMWRYDSAPLYIRTGVWPNLIEDPNTGRRWEPPKGAYVCYDKRRDPKPDPHDPVVAEATHFFIVRREGDVLIPREGLRQ